MTDNENIIYEILKFLNASRRDVNITDDILRNQFYFIDNRSYDSARAALILEKAISKTSANGQWQITEIGEIELNRLQAILDAIKRDPLASEVKETLDDLRIKFYRSQIESNKTADRKLYLGFIVGLLTTCAGAFLTYLLQKDSESTEQKVLIDIATHPPMKDTLYIIDTVKVIKKDKK